MSKARRTSPAPRSRSASARRPRSDAPGRDGPHELALALVAPAAGARRAEQALEDLRVVRGVQDEQSHPAEHRLVHALHDARRPPRRARCAPTRSARRCRPGLPASARARAAGASPCARARRSPERLGDARGDRAVHPVRVQRAHLRLVALVDVLAPHRDPQHSLTPTRLAGGQPNSNPRGTARTAAGSPYRGPARRETLHACSPLITSPGATWRASGRSDRRSARAAAPRSRAALSAAARTARA